MDGSCPKSYGTNVARLAGLPEVVVRRAAEFAEMLEARELQGKVGEGSQPGSAHAATGLTESERSQLRELGKALGSLENIDLGALQRLQECLVG